MNTGVGADVSHKLSVVAERDLTVRTIESFRSLSLQFSEPHLILVDTNDFVCLAFEAIHCRLCHFRLLSTALHRSSDGSSHKKIE